MKNHKTGRKLGRNQEFSYPQVLKIRAALNAYANYADNGRGLSNIKIAAQIYAITDVDIDDETIRRFRIGKNINKKTGRIEPPQQINAIAAALTDPSIDVLSDAELFSPDVPYTAPLKIAEFINPNSLPIPDQLNGTFVIIRASNDGLITQTILDIKVNLDDNLAHIGETIDRFYLDQEGLASQAGDRDSRSGWGFLTDSDILFIILRSEVYNDTNFYITMHPTFSFFTNEELSTLAVISGSEKITFDDDDIESSKLEMSSNLEMKFNDEGVGKTPHFLKSILRHMSQNIQIFQRTTDFSFPELEAHYKVIIDRNERIEKNRESTENYRAFSPASSTMNFQESNDQNLIAKNLFNLKYKDESNMSQSDTNEYTRRRLKVKFLRQNKAKQYENIENDPDYLLYEKCEILIAAIKDREKLPTAETIREYLDLGADVNYQSFDGSTILHHAASRQNRQVVEMLINYPGINHLIRDNRGRLAS